MRYKCLIGIEFVKFGRLVIIIDNVLKVKEMMNIV